MFYRFKNEGVRRAKQLLKQIEQPIPAIRVEIQRLKKKAVDINVEQKTLADLGPEFQEVRIKLAKYCKYYILKVKQLEGQLAKLEAEYKVAQIRLRFAKSNLLEDMGEPDTAIDDLLATVKDVSIEAEATEEVADQLNKGSGIDGKLLDLGMSQTEIDRLGK